MPKPGQARKPRGGREAQGAAKASSQDPTYMPLPEPVARFWAQRGSGAFAHPVYPLFRMISWHVEWKYDPPKESRARGVKVAAYAQAGELFKHPDMKALARDVRARRAAWIEPLVQHGVARRLVLRATTDVVLHLSSPGPLELGMAVHHVYGFPVLPATAIKGLAHAVAATTDASLADALYGRQETTGRVAILDGFPIEFNIRRDVMTPHFSAWYQNKPDAKPDDTDDPKPIPFLSVSAGSQFEVVLLARVRDTAVADLDMVESHVQKGCEERGLGAKTSAGYGAFERWSQPPVPMGNERAAGPRTTSGAEPFQPPAANSSTAVTVQVEALIVQVKALPANRVSSEINHFVDQCLKLEAEQERRLLARAIVEKAGVPYIQSRIKKGKRPEPLRKILELAGETTG